METFSAVIIVSSAEVNRILHVNVATRQTTNDYLGETEGSRGEHTSNASPM